MAIHGADVWRDGKPLNVIDFSSNVNPLAPPNGLLPYLRKIVGLSTRYPEADAISARAALASFHGLNKKNVVIGNGANELIHLICSAVPKGKALILAPTYSEYEQAVIGHGLKPYFYLSKHPFDVDLNDVKIEPGTSLIFLCNPNNPTGKVIKKDAIVDFQRRAEAAGATLVVDEVHMDLCDQEGESVINEGLENTVVLRSLTKLLGVPGLRLGYSVSSPEWASKIDAVRPAWNVNVLSIEVAKNWLDSNFIQKSKTYASRERTYLSGSLTRLGFEVIPSHTDYLLTRIKGMTSIELKEKLLNKGFLIRDASTIKGLNNQYVRIGALSHKKNTRLMRAVKELLTQVIRKDGYHVKNWLVLYNHPNPIYAAYHI
ncbi:MAG: pyridoxal phosphate-dependent aminotransferase [Thermoprotei archaeon]